MSPEEFTHIFPFAYHMAHVDSWPMIRKHGLLSTSALLDLFEIKGAPRKALESRHRPESITITHQKHGCAVIRDQKPMRERALRKCLQHLTPEQWYRILNSQVFFWLDVDRLSGLQKARAYRRDLHCVLKIKTALLLDKHLRSVRLSPINSGATIYNPRPRGRDTFLPLHRYPFDAWKKKRGSPKKAVVEMTVLHGVSQITDYLVSADIWNNGEKIKNLG